MYPGEWPTVLICARTGLHGRLEQSFLQPPNVGAFRARRGTHFSLQKCKAKQNQKKIGGTNTMHG